MLGYSLWGIPRSECLRPVSHTWGYTTQWVPVPRQPHMRLCHAVHGCSRSATHEAIPHSECVCPVSHTWCYTTQWVLVSSQPHSHEGKEATCSTIGAAKLQCCTDYRCQMYFCPKMGFAKCMDAYYMLWSLYISGLRRQKEEPQLTQKKA